MIRKYFHEETKRNFSIAVIWINGGSNMDNNGKRGINHILCSLITRGCKGFDNLALSDFLESYGGELNYEVLEDGMSISIKSLNSHFKKLFPLLNLIIKEPILSEQEFHKVKKSTLNLIRKEKENPFNICYEKWRKIVYSKHPYAFNTAGYEEDISNISYNDVLLEYEDFKGRNKYLISNNSEIKNECLEDSSITNFKEDINSPKNFLDKKLRFASSHIESNQVIIMLGNQTCSRKSEEFLPLKILESYLSFGMSSVLFKLFREKNGITYDVGVLNSIKRGNSPFCVYLSVSNKNALLAFELLITIWNQILSSVISDEEINLAKKKLISSFLMGNQFLDEILQRKIQLISYGLSPNYEENYISKLKDITPENILGLTKKHFAKSFLSITGDKKICCSIYNKWIKDS